MISPSGCGTSASPPVSLDASANTSNPVLLSDTDTGLSASDRARKYNRNFYYEYWKGLLGRESLAQEIGDGEDAFRQMVNDGTAIEGVSIKQDAESNQLVCTFW